MLRILSLDSPYTGTVSELHTEELFILLHATFQQNVKLKIYFHELESKCSFNCFVP